MARTTHNRLLDHHDSDLDTNVELDGAIAAPVSTASGSTVHQALVDTNAAFREGGMNVVIGSGLAVVSTGLVPLPGVELPFTGLITAWRLLADQSGSIAVAIWKDTYANYPPVVGDLLLTPAISTAIKAEATGLSHVITAGDILRFNVNSATTITQVTLALRIRRT